MAIFATTNPKTADGASITKKGRIGAIALVSAALLFESILMPKITRADILVQFQGAKEGQKITLIYTSEDTNTDQTVTGTLEGKFQNGDNYGLVLALPDGTQLELANTKENPNKIKKIEMSSAAPTITQSDILTAFQSAKEGQKITLIYTSEDTNTDQTVTGILEGKFQKEDSFRIGDNYGLVLALPDGTKLELANTQENPNKIKKIEISNSAPKTVSTEVLTQFQSAKEGQKITLIYTSEDTNTDQTATGTLDGKFQNGDNYGLVLTLPDGTKLELANTKDNPNKIKKIEIQPPEDEKPSPARPKQQPVQQRVAFEATVRDAMKTFASVSQAQAEKSAGISARNKKIRLKRQQDEEKAAAENARKQEQARLEAEASASKEAEHVKEITWSPEDYLNKYGSSSSYNSKSAVATDQYANTKDDSIFKLLYQELMDEKDHIFVRIGNNLRTAVPKEVDPTTGRKTYDVSEKDSNDMKLIVQKLTDLQERYLQLTGKKLQLPTEFSSN